MFLETQYNVDIESPYGVVNSSCFSVAMGETCKPQSQVELKLKSY